MNMISAMWSISGKESVINSKTPYIYIFMHSISWWLIGIKCDVETLVFFCNGNHPHGSQDSAKDCLIGRLPLKYQMKWLLEEYPPLIFINHGLLIRGWPYWHSHIFLNPFVAGSFWPITAQQTAAATSWISSWVSEGNPVVQAAFSSKIWVWQISWGDL